MFTLNYKNEIFSCKYIVRNMKAFLIYVVRLNHRLIESEKYIWYYQIESGTKLGGIIEKSGTKIRCNSGTLGIVRYIRWNQVQFMYNQVHSGLFRYNQVLCTQAQFITQVNNSIWKNMQMKLVHETGKLVCKYMY